MYLYAATSHLKSGTGCKGHLRNENTKAEDQARQKVTLRWLCYDCSNDHCLCWYHSLVYFEKTKGLYMQTLACRYVLNHLHYITSTVKHLFSWCLLYCQPPLSTNTSPVNPPLITSLVPAGCPQPNSSIKKYVSFF